ncbi:MAG: RnfABCDGE type electron transport complex subunit D [Treponema sp.]|nr:RnfABCDGE type electron transport complex subunit D [Treponema sp.]MCR5385615.1 RnfABCDGE type electron transport complex subunit D [Treponema sp.]
MLSNLNINKMYKMVNLSPFVNKRSTVLTYLFMILAIVPQVIMLFVTKSYDNLLIIGTAILACFFTEILNFVNKRHVNLSILLCILKGTLIGFFLPAGYPIFSVFFITLISMLFVKYAFGDLRVSWINPVVLTVAICWFIGRISFPGFLLTRDFLAAKNPSLTLIQEGIFPTYAFDEKITAMFNDTTFSLFGVSIPQGYVSLFWDSQSVIPAFRFNFLTIVFAILLIAFDVITFEIPFFYFMTYLILVKFLSPVFSGGIPMQGDMLLALLSSGTLFAGFILVQWFGTIPMTNKGKIFYGIAGGVIAFIFAGPGTTPIGSIITVLFLNILSPVIQFVENRITKVKLTNMLRNENAGDIGQ